VRLLGGMPGPPGATAQPCAASHAVDSFAVRNFMTWTS
jgi:hypothetical protein